MKNNPNFYIDVILDKNGDIESVDFSEDIPEWEQNEIIDYLLGMEATQVAGKSKFTH